MDKTITFCDVEPAPSDGTITFCDRKKEEQTKRLTFCRDDDTVGGEGCSSADRLFLFPPTIKDTNGVYELVSVGQFFTATGGVKPYVFIFPGVDRDTGEVVDIDPCFDKGPTLAKVTDTCGNAATELVKTDRHGLSLSGTAPPFIFSFDSGSIDSDTGEILSIDTCSASGDSRAGFVSVMDACGISTSIEVRLPGGIWSNQLIETQGICSGVASSGFMSLGLLSTLSYPNFSSTFFPSLSAQPASAFFVDASTKSG